MDEIINWERDFLTNCYTRNALYPFLKKMMGEVSLLDESVSILLIDLDHFKNLNDKHGHIFGDDALKYFCSTIRISLEAGQSMDSKQPLLFRYGGDEFIAVLPEKNSKEAYILASKILGNIKRRPFLFRERLFKMSFSGGIATFPGDAKTVEELIDAADKAAYFSKHQGKGRVTQFCKIKIMQFRRGLSIAVIVILLATGAYFLKTILSLEKTQDIKRQKMSVIYLNSGQQIKGIIIDASDPIQVKLPLSRGEGLISIDKQDIAKIEIEE